MATLLAIRGPLTGARFPIGEEALQIGRSPQASLTVPDNTVSRIHAMVRKHRNGYLLEDCDSSAGTFLNNKPVKAAVALSRNDEIRIGHSIFLFDSEFDLQNADFTDNSVYFSTVNDETVAVEPVATLDAVRDQGENRARHGMELLTEIGELFDGSRIPFPEALRATMERISRILRSDVALLLLYDNGAKELRASAAIASGDVLADSSVIKKVFAEMKALLISDKPDLVAHPAAGAPARPTVRSIVAAPIVVDDYRLGVLYLERQELDAYTLKDLRLVQSLGKLLAVFIEARQRAEALTLRQNFSMLESKVIGGGPRFRRTLELIRRVADTPSTVLLIGETGTGKEVLAAEIHRISPQGRENRPFVAVNCAAIPESLFESELFGHEKGSFTGAHKMRQGYIEQAQSGTLFLDEIGELTPSLQPKLLRFLQEHTYTRVGGNRLHRADVRVIAATNRDLAKDVKDGRFREDLYHRLSVLPVEVPPVRERREDIRALTDHFIQIYAKSLRKPITGISDEALIQLEKYDWPGNVRELANCLERAVLLSDGNVILPRHLSALGRWNAGSLSKQDIQISGVTDEKTLVFRPLEEVEKEYILKVYRAQGENQVRTSDTLGIHRNTLRKKLQDWGVVVGES
ncbi:sigma-54-dependent Fis family transcriptional regulator [soil metagenome]